MEPWLKRLLIVDTPTGRMIREGADAWVAPAQQRNQELRVWAAAAKRADRVIVVPFDEMSFAAGRPGGVIMEDWFGVGGKDKVIVVPLDEMSCAAGRPGGVIMMDL
eukprot:gene30817-35853_t